MWELLKIAIDSVGRWETVRSLVVHEPWAAMELIAGGGIFGWYSYKQWNGKRYIVVLAAMGLTILLFLPWIVTKLHPGDEVSYVFNETLPWIIPEDRRPEYHTGTISIEIKPQRKILRASWEVKSFVKVDSGPTYEPPMNDNVPIPVGTLRGDRSFDPVDISTNGEYMVIFLFSSHDSKLTLFCNKIHIQECGRFEDIKPGHYKITMEMKSDFTTEEEALIDLYWYGNIKDFHMTVKNL